MVKKVGKTGSQEDRKEEEETNWESLVGSGEESRKDGKSGRPKGGS